MTLPVLLLMSSLALLILLAPMNARQKRLEVADVVLTGRKRMQAYLMGRVLSEIKARIALLTTIGFDAKSIASKLSISTSTVSSYRSKGYEKLGVENKAELSELLRREAGTK